MTRAEVLQKTTNEFLKWVGYTEKNSKSDLAGRDYDNPGDYNEHAGSKNFTVFADLYKEKTGINVMIAQDAISCVALGTGKALDNLDALDAKKRR